jgi:predicted ATPase
MRIDSLWVTKLKNFDNFTIDFREDFPVNILLGQNGTGKSNLIEVIVTIFLKLEQSSSKKEFIESFTFDFKIKYCISQEKEWKYYLISKIEGVLIIQLGNVSDLSVENEISFNALKRIPEALYLPKYVIGYYSGSIERLKSIFKQSEQKYYKEVRSNRDQEIEFRRFFYADTYSCQLMLLSLLTYASTDKNIRAFLSKYLDFSEFVDFTVSLRSPDWNKGISLKDGINEFWGAKGTPLRFCNYLLVESKSEPVIEYNVSLDIKNSIRERVTFYLKGPDFLNNAIEYFDSGIDLFRHIESTYISGLIDKITIRIKKKSSNDIIEFSELSEGEQQLITILGLLLFTSDENTLFLLDEPDTHLNPNWQREYLKLFNNNTKNSHIVIATHSPLMVQSAEDAGIILFKLENGNPVCNSDTHFIHNWRIDQVLTSEYFGLKSARPPQLDKFMAAREALLNKAELTSEDKEKLIAWETDSGLLPSGETLNDFFAMHLVRSIAKDLKHDSDK